MAAPAPLGEVGIARADVSVEADVVRLVDAALSRFGRIELLVNNAAISCRKPVTELTLEEWNRVIGVNLTGVFLCGKYTTPSIARNSGVIINVSSTRALMSEANTEAVFRWKKAVVQRPPNLTVEDHRQHPVGCVGTPEDATGLVAYQASPDAGFITGANFVVGGE